jgi:hypothetical protein
MGSKEYDSRRPPRLTDEHSFASEDEGKHTAHRRTRKANTRNSHQKSSRGRICQESGTPTGDATLPVAGSGLPKEFESIERMMAFFPRYVARVRRQCPEAPDPEGIVQQVVSELWEKCLQTGESVTRGYLFAALRNKSIDALRRQMNEARAIEVLASEPDDEED